MAVVVGLGGVALFVRGVGYRRLAVAMAVTFGGAVAAAVGFWFVGAVVGLFLAGRGEGAGVAALVFAFLVAGVAALSVLVFGATRIVWRRQFYFERAARSGVAIAIGPVLLLVSVGTMTAHVVRITPALMSDHALTAQSSGLSGPLRAEAREELLARGQAAVPEVIAALKSADRREIQTFESGLKGCTLFNIELLGELGGPEAIAELRTWLNCACAADIRAAAARGLGEAGDRDSAHAIAVLLEDRSYEWRKSHFQLLRALTLLDAKEEWAHVKSALQFTADEEGTALQIGLLHEGIAALATFDTPEAQQAIAEIAAGGSGVRREAVERILRDMNKP
ncbi:MAG: hypothetical protein FJY92_07255, partial [Candidatus Hydrogenedentes bacterium]|nr:hypothetical protein [Candidatus Hydrogenedentota bacterium]